MAPSFHLFATDAFDAEEAGRICEQILQRQGTKSKMDLRQQPPAAVLSVLASSGWFRQVFGDKRFCFDDWYQTDCHEDGSCRLSVRHPSTSGMVQVWGVVLESSRNTRDESRGQYIFKGVKDAKHTAAFIITVLTLDHIGGASSRCVCNRDWGDTLPSQPSSLPAAGAPEEAGAAPEVANTSAPAPSGPATADVGSGTDGDGVASGGGGGGGPAWEVSEVHSLGEDLDFAGLFSNDHLINDSVLQGGVGGSPILDMPPGDVGMLLKMYSSSEEEEGSDMVGVDVPPLDLTGRVAQTPPSTGRDEFRAAKSMKCHQGSATKSAVSELARGSGNGMVLRSTAAPPSYDGGGDGGESDDDGADDGAALPSESDNSDSEEDEESAEQSGDDNNDDENVIVLGEEHVPLPNGYLKVMKRKNQATTWAAKFIFLGKELYFGTSYPTKKKAEKALKMGRVLFREEVQKIPNVSKDELKRDLKLIAETVKVKCQKGEYLSLFLQLFVSTRTISC